MNETNAEEKKCPSCGGPHDPADCPELAAIMERYPSLKYAAARLSENKGGGDEPCRTILDEATPARATDGPAQERHVPSVRSSAPVAVQSHDQGQSARIAELERRVGELTEERDEMESYATALAGIDADRDRLAEEVATLRAQLAEREEDRKDLDWLEANKPGVSWHDSEAGFLWSVWNSGTCPRLEHTISADTLRAAIRAARAQEDGK